VVILWIIDEGDYRTEGYGEKDEGRSFQILAMEDAP
jgi:hypothetical protein